MSIERETKKKPVKKNKRSNKTHYVCMVDMIITESTILNSREEKKTEKVKI